MFRGCRVNHPPGDATRRDYRAQGKQFPADDRIQGLDQVICVDARIYSTQLAGRCRPLQAARLGLILAGEQERYVANLRIEHGWRVILVVILRVRGGICRKSTHKSALEAWPGPDSGRNSGLDPYAPKRQREQPVLKNSHLPCRRRARLQIGTVERQLPGAFVVHGNSIRVGRAP
jgi:hypothetical protein